MVGKSERAFVILVDASGRGLDDFFQPGSYVLGQ